MAARKLDSLPTLHRNAYALIFLRYYDNTDHVLLGTAYIRFGSAGGLGRTGVYGSSEFRILGQA